MDVVSVTLDEVLSAANARAASLVPETAGYFALAIADATARLPYRIGDELVSLTTEGTVKVARGRDVMPPDACTAVLRDGLARLLGAAVGSMPGLANTARAREESEDGVESYIRELEAALVPVNRAAARRALGRLARETAKARDAGKLRRRRVRPARPEAPPRAPTHASRPPSAPAPSFAASHEPERRSTLHPRPEPMVAAPELSPASSFEAAPAAPADAAWPVLPVELPPPAPEAMLEIDVDLEQELAVADPTPTDMRPPVLDMAPTTVDAPTAPRGAARDVLREPTQGAKIGGCVRSDVDDLLDRFVVSTIAGPDALKASRASLKRLAGLDPTPPPPSAVEIKRMTEQLPPRATGKVRIRLADDVETLPTPPLRKTMPWAWVAFGLVVAGLLGHFLPAWLA